MTVKYVPRSLYLLKKSVVVLVLGILPIARQGNANGIASLVSSKNQNSSSGIELKFDQRKRNLVRVSWEYELSEFELSKKKQKKKVTDLKSRV